MFRVSAAGLALGWLVAGLAALVAGPGPSSSPPADDDACSVCGGEPELMQRLGVVSHGPIAIGPEAFGGSAAFPEKLVASEWLFLETEHLRWASSLAGQTLDRKDQERLEPYFARLRAAGADLPDKVRKLDPDLRLHLMALRAEDLYGRFLGVIGHAAEDFPEARGAEGPYLGDGRFLGEKDKYEVVLHANRQTHLDYTEETMGAIATGSLRWHFKAPHKVAASIPCTDPDLREDRWLWPHTVHNLTHLFLAGYKHFSYQPPVWLDEGLALALEREAEPTSVTTEGEEGSLNENLFQDDWVKERKQLLGKEAPTFAVLLRQRTLGQLDEPELISCWLRVRFLLEAHPEDLATFIGLVKGQLDEQGYPTGAGLDDLQRKALRDLWGWTPDGFDAAFRAWLDAEG